MTDIVEIFFEAWGETDAEARAATLRGTLADAFEYLDPRTAEPVTDAEALIGYVAMYSEYAPGATAGVVHQSQTGGHTRATVEFAMPDGKKQHGQYFIEHDADGKLARMIGFVGMGTPE
ncbi:MAG: molecular chaperone GroEL [Thalassovita sp.]